MSSGRVQYVDGLRGIAIVLTVVFHARLHATAVGPLPQPLEAVTRWGYQGVSLFLVVSGFCLSYPALRRLKQGDASWFSPSVFFARRCMRILPPYYAALLLFVIAGHVLPRALSVGVSSMGGDFGLPDVTAHLLLIHNLTYVYSYTINSSFWSLGLEWQWYFLFPVILVLSLRRPLVALAGCAALALLWHLGMRDLWLLSHSPYVSGALAERLFEFCSGIIAAQLVVSGRALRTSSLLPMAVLSLFGVLVVDPHFGQLFCGVFFASLLLLGHSNDLARTVLSWRPLTDLGVASYGIYLVHEPFVQAVEVWAPALLSHSSAVLLLAAATGVTAGLVFHVLVERPLASTLAVGRLLPIFAWCCRGADRFYRITERSAAVRSG